MSHNLCGAAQAQMVPSPAHVSSVPGLVPGLTGQMPAVPAPFAMNSNHVSAGAAHIAALAVPTASLYQQLPAAGLLQTASGLKPTGQGDAPLVKPIMISAGQTSTALTGDTSLHISVLDVGVSSADTERAAPVNAQAVMFSAAQGAPNIVDPASLPSAIPTGVYGSAPDSHQIVPAYINGVSAHCSAPYEAQASDGALMLAPPPSQTHGDARSAHTQLPAATQTVHSQGQASFWPDAFADCDAVTPDSPSSHFASGYGPPALDLTLLQHTDGQSGEEEPEPYSPTAHLPANYLDEMAAREANWDEYEQGPNPYRGYTFTGWKPPVLAGSSYQTMLDCLHEVRDDYKWFMFENACSFAMLVQCSTLISPNDFK